jgi:asparagine synthase (glutamine-hydrolysing)
VCGIVGIYRLREGRQLARDDLAQAFAALAHRGPDGEGVHEGDGVLLGNRRLAVIDRDGGSQPMSTPDGGATITFNGEIHDYLEHRDALESEGVVHASRSDTEVLLNLLARKGLSALRDLTGMYAFGLHEAETGRLTLARDPFGVKPLLYIHEPERGEIAFASELTALLVSRRLRPGLDVQALLERIAFQFPLTARTMARGIRTLPPGAALIAEKGGKVRLGRWHHVTFASEDDPSEEDWAEEIRAALERSARLTLRSDVPLGVTLSGGLDSSLVAALAARESGRPLLAFTGYFPEGDAYDERAHSRPVAEELGLQLVEVIIKPEDLLDHLRELAITLEGPIAGPGSFAQLMVARAAKDRVTVLLGGQGADETFGGYARHRIAWLEERGRLDPDALPHDLFAYGPLVRHFLADGVGEPFEDRFFRLVYRGEGMEDLIGPVLRDAWEEYDPREAFRAAFRKEDGDPFHRMVSFERRHLLPALLHVEDRVTMARSLESRVPLLDPALVAISARIPSRTAFADGELKRILRIAARGLAPRGPVERLRKMGFPVPLGRWARGPLRKPLLERLMDGPLVREGILAADAPNRLLETAGGHGRHLWLFLLLSEWMEGTGIGL